MMVQNFHVSFANKDSTVGHHINEFNLSVPYDISSGFMQVMEKDVY